MTPHVVVDVGNTRIKWGLCTSDAVTEMVSLPPDDAAAWQAQRARWSLGPGSQWVIAGVHPAWRTQLANWLQQQGEQVRLVTHPSDLRLRTLLAEPEKAGIDRLLDAVAVNRRRTAGCSAVIVDAGSAVTVDYLDESGAFAGGAILPGFRLMAQALHDYTALLPLIEPPRRLPSLPGTATIPAMEAGIAWAIAGAVQGMLAEYRGRSAQPVELFLTGGDAAWLQSMLPQATLCPALTLEGLRWTAETLS